MNGVSPGAMRLLDQQVHLALADATLSFAPPHGSRREAVIRAIAECQAAGELRADVTPDRIAQMLASVCHGVLLRLPHERRFAGEAELRAELTLLLDCLARGTPDPAPR